jgi:hypothetical protein
MVVLNKFLQVNMKKELIFTVLLIIIVITFIVPAQSQAQAAQDTIFVERSFWGNSYFIGGKEFERLDIINLLDTNSYTKKLMSTWRSKREWAYLTLTAGVLMTFYVGYETWISYNNYGVSPLDPSWGLGRKDESGIFILKSAIALGLDITGIIMIIGSNKTFNKAIGEYNKSLFVSNDRIHIYIGMNRIGLSIPLD